jgi:hypothetical protein
MLREVVEEQDAGRLLGDASLLHDGEVDDDGVTAVPFLLELLAGVPAAREDLVELLACIVSPMFETAGNSERARQTVRAGVDAVVALAADPQPAVRASAYLVIGWSGGPTNVLWERWAAEDDPDARTGLLVALVAADPDIAQPVLAGCVTSAVPQERLAAVLGLHQAGLALPRGAGAALAEAVLSGTDQLERVPVSEPVSKIVGDTDDEAFVAEFLAAALRPDARSPHALYALSTRCDKRRSAPGRYLPLLRPVLTGAGGELWKTAVWVASMGGRATAELADVFADIVAKLPDVTGNYPVTPEHNALGTLRKLGDPRWVAPACRLWDAGGSRWLGGDLRFGPVSRELIAALDTELLAAVAADRRRVVEALVREIDRLARPYGRPQDRHHLKRLVPALRAALPVAPVVVRRALLALGAATDADLYALLGAEADRGDLGEVAVELCRRTGDTAPLAAALTRAVHDQPKDLPGLLRQALPGGPAFTPILPLIEPLQDDPVPEVRIAAAHLLHLTGGTDHALPIARMALLRGNPYQAQTGAQLARDLCDPALEPQLRARLDGGPATLAAAEALLALGVPATDLTEPLLRWLPTCHYYAKILYVCRDVLDPSAAPRLRDLATRDARTIGGLVEVSSEVWGDEQQTTAIFDALAAIPDRGQLT